MPDAFEVVVVGGGLAGLTAALFAARCGRSTAILVPLAPGGSLIDVDRIEDFPGFPDGVAGYELGPIVQEQAEAAGAAVRMAEAERLEADGHSWLVHTADGALRARAVVLATGTRPRALGVPGEARFRGQGVSSCASCDAPLFAGRKAAIIGGGDSALKEALTVAEHAGHTVVLHSGPRLEAQATYRMRAEQHPAIEIRPGATIMSIEGDNAVTGVRLTDGERLELAAVFVYVGGEPETALLPAGVQCDDSGRVVTDAALATSAPGLFAAGDVRSGSSGQAISAAGDGAAAAMSAHRYLASRY